VVFISKNFLLKKLDVCIVLYMKKFVSLLVLFFFISATFTVVFHPVVASTMLIENSWTTKNSMNQARFGLGVIAVDGKIYAIGGCTSVDDFLRPNNFVGTNERYDPETDTWLTLKPMPTPRHNFAIAECKGKIYCIGGYIVEGSRWVIYNTVETYDPATDSWNTKAALPFTEADLTACVVDEKIYVFTANSGSPVYMYNTATDSWTTKTHIPNTTLLYYAPTVVDNKILFTSLYLTTKIYDPATNEWTEKKANLR
jgi:N-acetylneuraminic acid mutarotase